jgi:hypothetical protein
MRKAKSSPAGHGKLLDAWTPPEEAGEAIGCVATTFTFKAEFFEEECLGRFLQLETDPAEDGPAYLIEREEKLAQLTCAAVLADQHHVRDCVRNLRWDLLSARPVNGILHAKISLLLWSKRARLIIASANLTEDGYRRNLEVFGALDYHADAESPLAVLDDCIAFLREAAVTTQAGADSAAVRRWNAFLAQVTRVTRAWGNTELPRSGAQPRVFAVLSGPQRASVFESLQAIKPETGALTDAYVVSPFFDPPEATNEPARQLWTLLKQRGDASVQYHVAAEEVPGENAMLVHAPESLLHARPEDTQICQLVLDADRPLHAKCLSLENERSVIRLIGSSNFTSAGLGLGKTKNWEANLAYVVRTDLNREAWRALECAWPEVDDLPDDKDIRYQPATNTDDEASDEQRLPPAFADAVFTGTEVHLHFAGEPPKGWIVFDGEAPFADDAAWHKEGRPEVFQLAWSHERPPSGFSVTWPDSKGPAWWPVNVLSAEVLPLPADLRHLSLDALIEMLTTSRSLHEALCAWRKRHERDEAEADGALIDPHKRVDTSAFLLQRTRRVAAALNGLRQRLEKTVASEAALHWRLRGPIGVLSLASAITREAKSDAERAFLLLELCLEVRRVTPVEAPGCLSKSRLHAALREVIADLRATIPTDAFTADPAMKAYASAVFEEVSA